MVNLYGNEDYLRFMFDLFSSPLFKKGFLEYFLKMQREGIEAARRFWSPVKDLPPRAPEIFEKIIDFYLILGFVPSYKYEEAVAEAEKLSEENRFLKDTLKELQSVIFTSGGKFVQESWSTVIDRQFDLNKEITKNFFDLFRALKSGPSKKGRLEVISPRKEETEKEIMEDTDERKTEEAKSHA